MLDKGVSMMLGQVFKTLGINPETIMQSINSIAGRVLGFDAKLDELRAANARMEHKLDFLCARASTEDHAGGPIPSPDQLALPSPEFSNGAGK